MGDFFFLQCMFPSLNLGKIHKNLEAVKKMKKSYSVHELQFYSDLSYLMDCNGTTFLLISESLHPQ